MQTSEAYLPTGLPPGHAKAHRFHAAVAGQGLIASSGPWRNSEARGAGRTARLSMIRAAGTTDEQMSIGLYTIEAYKYMHFGAKESRNMTTTEQEELARRIDEMYAVLDALQDEQVALRARARGRTREGVMA